MELKQKHFSQICSDLILATTKQQYQMFKLYKNLYFFLKSMDKELAIKLTPDEQKIFGMLKRYRDQLGLKTVLRVAGGWVRDKVLGKQSKDIDIALDNMKGQEFVTLLKKHSQNSQDKISGFGVTKFNPQLSKHLQTATAKIDNHWIDFVNLRCEQYNEDSRIPAMVIKKILQRFGTPLEDAERRDFTINSLFYNLDSEEVEDYTGNGLSDLHNQLIRTPLDPLITFKDDPLRILRCLRFKSRLNFKVDPRIYQSIKNQQIKEALQKKVSKQRVGIELSGLLKAKHFQKGLSDILTYGLWNIVFEVPKDCELFTKNQILGTIPDFSYHVTSNFVRSLQKNTWMTEKQLICQQQLQQKQKPKKKQKIQYPSSQLQFMILLSSLTYFYRDFEVKVGKTKNSLVSYMIKDQLKYSAKHAKFATHFIQSVEKLKLIKQLNNAYEIIRWLRFAQEKWELTIHFLWSVSQTTNQEVKINLFQLREEILKKNLAYCYLAEAPIDGTFLTKKGIKGPSISKILQNAVIWRIVNPNLPNQAFQKEFEERAEFFASDTSYR